jgi:outer membrane receptor for ferrienterochelin and colicin
MQAILRQLPPPRFLTLAICWAWTCDAQAQAQQQPVDNTVVVTGQRASIRKAILQQEGADNIVSVVSADDIGALPDINASEAAARLPGISVQRDQGEGRYVTVRGLGPDLNAVTINGALAGHDDGVVDGLLLGLGLGIAGPGPADGQGPRTAAAACRSTCCRPGWYARSKSPRP